MPGLNRESPKYLEARASLPPSLQSIFDALAEDYAFFTTTQYGTGYVAYKVIAELVRAGWRKTEGSAKGE